MGGMAAARRLAAFGLAKAALGGQGLGGQGLGQASWALEALAALGLTGPAARRPTIHSVSPTLYRIHCHCQ